MKIKNLAVLVLMAGLFVSGCGATSIAHITGVTKEKIRADEALLAACAHGGQGGTAYDSKEGHANVFTTSKFSKDDCKEVLLARINSEAEIAKAKARLMEVELRFRQRYGYGGGIPGNDGFVRCPYCY